MEENYLDLDSEYETAITPRPLVQTRQRVAPQPFSKRMAAWLQSQWQLQNFWLLAALILAAVAHCWNMFAYPYLENDEGLYAAQANSVFNEGKLTPYTYWYDHPPVGWMQLGMWLRLTGLMTFGNAVNNGRVFIAILYVISCYFLFKLVVQFSQKWLNENSSLRYLTGFAAVAILSLSPLSLFFQRQVLLDNIMVMWVLAAFYILFVRYPKEHNLLELYGSGVALSIGILSKEIAIVYVPVMLWMVWWVADRHHRRFAVLGWLAVVASLVSVWFLYALLKGEFLPSGSGVISQHVSIINTLQFQAGRGTGLPFWKPGSDFLSNWTTNWATLDKFTPILGLIALTASLVLGLIFKRLRVLLVPVLPALVYGAFLLRGGIVLYYYILPMLPWMAMAIAMLGSVLLSPLAKIQRPSLRKAIAIGAALMLVLTIGELALWQADSYYGKKLLSGDQTYGQRLARDYVLNNVPNNAFIVADDFFYLDLRQPVDASKAKPDTQIYMKVDTDPEIGQQKLHGDWRNIDYMLVTLQQMQKDIQQRDLPILNEAYQHSRVIQTFPSREGWQLQLRQIEPVEIIAKSFPAGQVLKPGETFQAQIAVTPIRDNHLSNMNMLLEIRRNGVKVGQDVVKVPELTPGSTQNVDFKWTVPANAEPGDYEINVGSFDQSWTNGYLWKTLKETLNVQ